MSNSALVQITKQYQVLNDWFLSSLEDISDEEGKRLLPGQSNTLEWLAGHLITGRYRNIARLGITLEPYAYLDKFVNVNIPPPNAIAYNPEINYPSLSAGREQWKIYADHLTQGLTNATDELLKKELPFTVITGNTVEDVLVFISLHESYHIGQISIMRRTLGYGAISLGRRK